jgi:Fe2+ or Zn2+ uptake regulation protein
MFALYDHKRHHEAICYSNDTVFKIMQNNIAKAIQEKQGRAIFRLAIMMM